jgi:uncharacterized membrane protein YoaK (UPF0700 family)
MASIAVGLTLLAGYVDAVGYLSLGQVYVANMSGNSIAVAVYGANLDWREVWKYGWPVMSFTLGLFLSRLLVGWGMRAGWRSVAAPAIGVEALALVAFSAVPPGTTGVFLAACAMGVQAATLARFNGVTVYTCFVTGSLVKFAEDGAELLLIVLQRRPPRACHIRGTIWFALIWTAYVAGAILGANALHLLARASILLAAGALLLVCLIDRTTPVQLEKSVP